MIAIKVTGILNIDEDEFDAGPNGPLTEEAYNEYSSQLGLEDLDFEVAK